MTFSEELKDKLGDMARRALEAHLPAQIEAVARLVGVGAEPGDAEAIKAVVETERAAGISYRVIAEYLANRRHAQRAAGDAALLERITSALERIATVLEKG